MPAIYDAIIKGGAQPFSMYALNSLRIVKFDKEQDFTCTAALLAEKQQGRKKAFAPLIIDAGEADAPFMSTIWHNGEIVGETTSGAWGYRVNASVALAMLRPEVAQAGTELEVEIYGERRKAVVQRDQPLWDPENERLRA